MIDDETYYPRGGKPKEKREERPFYAFQFGESGGYGGKTRHAKQIKYHKRHGGERRKYRQRRKDGYQRTFAFRRLRRLFAEPGNVEDAHSSDHQFFCNQAG